MALALRLAAFELLRADGEDPVLLLDDVFAELDTGRRDRLAGLVAGAEQVLVTAAVPADVPAACTAPASTWPRGGCPVPDEPPAAGPVSDQDGPERAAGRGCARGRQGRRPRPRRACPGPGFCCQTNGRW